LNPTIEPQVLILPLERREFDTHQLVAEHPPVWHHPNKVAATPESLASSPASRARSRWRAGRFVEKKEKDKTPPMPGGGGMGGMY
jgi:hypothetical protein